MHFYTNPYVPKKIKGKVNKEILTKENENALLGLKYEDVFTANDEQILKRSALTSLNAAVRYTQRTFDYYDTGLNVRDFGFMASADEQDL